MIANQTAAERAAGVLRERIIDGDLRPGTRLVEDDLVGLLEVSRNTLREAFRLLTHDGLLVHRLHRGVCVAELDAFELVDLYRLRRIVECDVVRSLHGLDEVQLGRLQVEVEAAEAAAASGDWVAVGTANMRFHQELVGLAESERLDKIARQLLAELRLVFHVADSPRRLHEGYVERNRLLLQLLEKQDFSAAAEELERYLRQSEAQLLAAYHRSSRQPTR